MRLFHPPGQTHLNQTEQRDFPPSATLEAQRHRAYLEPACGEFVEPVEGLPVLLQETVAEFLILVLRNYKCRNILFLPAEILRVLVSQAKRVVIIPTCLKYLDALALFHPPSCLFSLIRYSFPP